MYFLERVTKFQESFKSIFEDTWLYASLPRYFQKSLKTLIEIGPRTAKYYSLKKLRSYEMSPRATLTLLTIQASPIAVVLMPGRAGRIAAGRIAAGT
jgi:hypothetical protein